MQPEPPKAEPPKRKRRWLRFSLWALMIGVTLLAMPLSYVGWQAKIVRARKAWMADKKSFYFTEHPHVIARGDATQSPCLIRSWLGDESQKTVVVSISDPIAAKQAAVILFPEANVYECLSVP